MRLDIVSIGVFTLVVGMIIVLVVLRFQRKKLETKQQLEQERIDAEYSQKVRDLELGVKDELHKQRDLANKEISQRRSRISEEERRMEQRRSKIDRDVSDLQKRENELSRLKVEINKKNQEVDQSIEDQTQELQRIANLTKK